MAGQWQKQITFDRFIRGVLAILLVVGIFLLLKRLSGVLLPFFVAWLMAYLLNPLVCFFQKKCKMKYRILGILSAFIVVGGVLYGVFMLMIPPMWSEVLKVKDMLVSYIEGDYSFGGLSDLVKSFLMEHLNIDKLKGIFSVEGLFSLFEDSMPKLWGVLTSSFRALSGILSLTMVLLYTLFILLDYEKFSRGWVFMLPAKMRGTAKQLVNDVRAGMNKYFKGQAIIAISVGILLSIGFLIIDFPMAVALGLFFGLLNMVPYLQVVGFIPAILLAVVKAADTGQSFWLIMLAFFVVFAVVQTIQDTILTPKIMGKVSGLNSAIILLSLSIWGSLLGILGMIIAIPLTTLLLTYYQRYIVKIPARPSPEIGPPADIPEQDTSEILPISDEPPAYDISAEDYKENDYNKKQNNEKN